jgi:hypothetical protein
MARASKKIHVSAGPRPGSLRQRGPAEEAVVKRPSPAAGAAAAPATAHYLERKQLSGKIVRLNLTSLRLDIYRPVPVRAAI